MRVSIETTIGLERKMTIEVPSAQVDSAINKRLQELTKTAKIDGFRPGKVPLRVIEKKFGASVRHEVTDELMRRNLYEAFQQEKINPVGAPYVEPSVAKSGENFSFTATFEVFPEFKVTDLSKKKVEQLTSTISDDDISGMIDKLREQHCDWSESKAKSKKDHKVNIDFDGFIDGEKFEGGSAEGHDLVLGSGSMIKGFEEGIIGTKAGEEVTLDIVFPEDYHHKDFAGKPVKFEIKVNKVLNKKLPELNDEFAQKFDIKEGGIEALTKDITKNMERELENKLKELNKEVIFNQLIEVNKVDIPKAAIDEEIKRMQAEMLKRIGGGDNNMDISKLPDLPRDLFEKQAQKKVHLGMIAQKYLQQTELKVDSDRLEAILEKMSLAYDDPKEWKNWIKSNKAKIAGIESLELEEQLVEKLIENAKITEKNMSYSDLMNYKVEQ